MAKTDIVAICQTSSPSYPHIKESDYVFSFQMVMVDGRGR